MLTIEICCQVLQHPVYFCDGATTPLLGYDVVSAASLVIDTEARQLWSKHTVQYGHAEPFTPPAVWFVWRPRFFLSRQLPPIQQPFAARQLLRQLPSTQPPPTRQPSTTLPLLRQLPPAQPPPTRHLSVVRQLLRRQLPSTRPLLLRPSSVSQLLTCQQLPPQLPATLLLRRWRPFVCRRASHRGPLATAS